MARAVVILALFFSLTLLAPAQSRTVGAEKGLSSMTYRISHPLHKIEATSGEVMYQVKVDPQRKKVLSVEAQVDVMTFNSGNSNRDSHAMEVIDAITYPDASFSSSEVYQAGDSLSVMGNLTFHGTTRSISIPAMSQWYGDSLQVNAAFNISMTDFKIDRPSLLMIPVDDTIHFAMQATFSLK
jgi:polyisoprenoid-binding protein YceI